MQEDEKQTAERKQDLKDGEKARNEAKQNKKGE